MVVADADLDRGLYAGGTLQGLAVSTDKRLPDWPDLPTFKEQGQ